LFPFFTKPSIAFVSQLCQPSRRLPFIMFKIHQNLLFLLSALLVATNARLMEQGRDLEAAPQSDCTKLCKETIPKGARGAFGKCVSICTTCSNPNLEEGDEVVCLCNFIVNFGCLGEDNKGNCISKRDVNEIIVTYFPQCPF
jgi:hypothetical protein